MASYNQDFNRMQEEALRRMREMQSRSRTAVNRPSPPHEPAPPPSHGGGQHQHRHQVQQDMGQHTNSNTTDVLKSILGDVKIDSEKALILLMLFVLYKNKADLKLLLALGYLII